MISRRRRFVIGLVVGLLLLCLLYCLIAPNQYEAPATVALRMQPVSALTVDAVETVAPASILSTPLQLETLVNILRSQRLAWRVLTELKLYESKAFSPAFPSRFPDFDPEKPSPEAESYLLERFDKRLKVRALPRTLLIEVRFRSRDAAQSAAVANALIRDYMAGESEARVAATGQASQWLEGQLQSLTAEAAEKQKQLAEFERRHGFLASQQTTPSGLPMETIHDTDAQQVDEMGRLLAAAAGDRIVREALYREAQGGNPEQVLAANPGIGAQMSPGGAAMAQQLRTHLSEVQVEMAQLRAEHGPNFPRVVELDRARQELEEQIKAVDAGLIEAFRRSWTTAQDREKLLKRQLEARMAEGLGKNDAALQYEVLREEVISEGELRTRLKRRIEEAELSAGVHGSALTVVDAAREPFKPAAPDLPLYMAITLFAGLWLAMGGGLLLDAFHVGKGKEAKR